MGISVTIYNDDPHGRDIQVFKINTRTSLASDRKVLKRKGDDSPPYCTEITQDEFLLVAPAESVGEGGS